LIASPAQRARLVSQAGLFFGPVTKICHYYGRRRMVIRCRNPESPENLVNQGPNGQLFIKFCRYSGLPPQALSGHIAKLKKSIGLLEAFLSFLC
jgi:hypothetical protein